jgi:hypothetical protein
LGTFSAKKNLIFPILLVILVSTLTTATRQSDASASSVQNVSGNFNLMFSNYAGVSEYTIDYRYPATVNVGQTFNVTIVVYVDELTELKLYLYDWGVVSTLNSPAGPPISGQIAVNKAYDYLYAGSHWGPVNISIPITPDNFSISAGKNYISSVALEWIADVQYDKPYSWHFYESNTTNLGNVTLVDQAQSGAAAISLHSYIDAAVVFFAVMLAIAGWISVRKPGREKLLRRLGF